MADKKEISGDAGVLVIGLGRFGSSIAMTLARLGHDVLACGPEPMLRAVAALAPDAQLAWEAPMACGYGACYGCAVEIDGKLERLCVEGPVLEHAA